VRPKHDTQEVISMTIDTSEAQIRNPAFQAFLLLRAGFTVAPILFGVDKFFNFMVDWPDYLAPWINDIAPGSGQDFMYVVGVVEIAAGLIVGLAPSLGAFVVAGWLGGIIVNLLTVDPPTYYDIALRDFGLMLAALTLARLALSFRRTAKAAEVPRSLRQPESEPLVG
jgi:DoxX